MTIQNVLEKTITNKFTDTESKLNISLSGYSENCKALIKRGDHILVGISPFNSRFSASYVNSTLEWAHLNFRKVDILLPDEKHAAMLFSGLTESPNKVNRKVRKELNRHHRSIERSLQDLGDVASTTTVIKFCDFFEAPDYKKIYNSILDTFDNSEKFRNACFDMSSQAISGKQADRKWDGANVDKKTIEAATPYIFVELPFYLDTPALIGERSSVFAYHRVWPIGKKIWEGAFPLRISTNQGHGIFKHKIS